MMKMKISLFLAILLTITTVVVAGCSSTTEPTATPDIQILVIHSYHEGWAWNSDIEAGIIEGLSQQGYAIDIDYEIETFYMDTKVTYTTVEQIEERAALAVDMIEESDPDIIFVNDDNALKYVAVEYAADNPESVLPFVFCGINIDPSVYEPVESLEHPGGKITGTLERFPYSEAFALAVRIAPDAESIVLLADSSTSSDAVLEDFRANYLNAVNNSPIEMIGFAQLNTFDEWKAAVTEYQTQVDFVGIITYHQLRDDSGNVVPAQDVVDWTVANNNLPELGFLTFHAEDGYLSTAGVDGYKTGIYTGIIGGDILNGTDPGNIPIVNPDVVEIAFNLCRADMLGITIPTAELAAAGKVFHSIGINGTCP
ncbi:MAG: ABC transporter substrate binding protein [Dehalococcoidia bacterium]